MVRDHFLLLTVVVLLLDGGPKPEGRHQSPTAVSS
jgi:hypothetical protein